MAAMIRYSAALFLALPGACFAQVTWDFNSDNAFPIGWFTEGQGGSWAVTDSQFGVGGGNVLRATVNPPPLNWPPGEDPEIRVDAYTPEFRFDEIETAELGFDFDVQTNGGVLDSLLVTLHPVLAGVLDKGTGYALWQHIELDAGSTPPLPIRVVDDGIGFVPEGHMDGVSVYRARMRVFDGDLNKQSLLGVEVDNLQITSAFFNVPYDYNRNGIVDAADYILWRDTFGSSTELRADGDGDAVVDEDDYELWKRNFGATSGPAGGQGALAGRAMSVSVPEPASVPMIVLVTGLMACLVRRPSCGQYGSPSPARPGWGYPDR